MAKAFTRGQTQVLFRHLPEAIFEHDDYGLCKVTRVALGDVSINKDALFDAMGDALAMWSTPGFSSKFPDPRDAGQRALYAVGIPREVRFTPYPQVFSCRSCGRTAKFEALVRRGAAANGRCPACNGAMNRLRYVQAHNCGRLDELFVPSQKCPNGHGPEHLAFYDPGRVKQAYWHCRICNAHVQALRMTPCKCAYNESLPPGQHPEKYLKVVPTGDPSLYVPHTVAFINFPEDTEGKLRAAPDSQPLMLAKMWGMLATTVADTIRARQSVGSAEDADDLAQLVEQLRKFDPTNDKVREYDEKRAKPKGQDAIDRVRELLGVAPASLNAAPARWLVEYITLLERTSLCTTEDVAKMLRHRGDKDGARDIEQAVHQARDVMGIQTIRVINDFPLALCAFGYTRTSRDPARTVISPFPQDERGKVPIFAVEAETEALWFQLDPLRVADWLAANGLAAGPAPAGHEEAWAFLHSRVAGLRQSANEPAYGQREAVAVRMLLHTMSHVFLRRIEWSGFSPSSVGEYLIPGSLSFILYANRHAETKIGGLTTLFEQRLNTWLWDAVQAGHECIYDPICEDDGGSCAGCTHREHNCVSFNRELSRATLYGGPTPQIGALEGMPLRRGYWRDAWQTAPTQ